MSDVITDSAGLSGPVSEGPAPKTTRKRTVGGATKKAAKEAPVVVDNVVIEEMDNNSVTEEGQTVITGPKKDKPARRSNSFVTDTGAIGSRAADSALNSKVDTTVSESKSEVEKIALWSDKNIRWGLNGSLSKGYNIVEKEKAELWLTRDGIREATPQEVATYYSN